MTLILESPLPDKFEVMLCGRRSDFNNETEVEACFKSASACATAERAQPRQSPRTLREVRGPAASGCASWHAQPLVRRFFVFALIQPPGERILDCRYTLPASKGPESYWKSDGYRRTRKLSQRSTAAAPAIP